MDARHIYKMQYQKSKIWHQNVYLASRISIIFHLVSRIFRVSHFTSRILYFLLAHFSRQLGTSQPCISHVISHTLHSFNLASHIFLFHSFASYISHLIFFMPHNVTYVYVYDICLWHMYDTCHRHFHRHIWHMTHMTHMTHVLYFIWHICHRHFHRHMSYVYV